MGRFFLRWIVLAGAFIIAAFLTEWLFGMAGWQSAFRINVDWGNSATMPMQLARLLIGVAVFAVVNATLGNILRVVTVPFNCLTLGLFSLIVNALMLWLAGSLEIGFTVANFGSALIGSILIAMVNGLLGRFVDKEED